MSTKGDYISIKVLSAEARKAYQIQVVSLRSEGLNAPTIAKRLKLNRATVQDWVKRLDAAQGDVKVLEETKREPNKRIEHGGQKSYHALYAIKELQSTTNASHKPRSNFVLRIFCARARFACAAPPGHRLIPHYGAVILTDTWKRSSASH